MIDKIGLVGLGYQKFNAKMLKQFIRKNNRLPHKSLYKSNNWYFVTICTQDKLCIFEVVSFGDACTVNGGGSGGLNNGETGSPLRYSPGFNHRKIWQKSFYDHIIRDVADLPKVQEYIGNDHNGNKMIYTPSNNQPKCSKPSNNTSAMIS